MKPKPLTLADLRKVADAGYQGMRAPRLADMASFINANFPKLEARMEDWSYSGDRKIGRLRVAGKLRKGKRLAVYNRGKCFLPAIFTHNPMEPYRRNYEVARWIVEQAAK